MSATAQTVARPLWFKLMFALSLFGPLLKDAKKGGDTALSYFLLNLVLLWVLAGFTWGIAGVLGVAYALMPVAFAFMLGIMLFSGK